MSIQNNKKAHGSDQSNTISTKHASQLLMLTERRILQLSKDGYFSPVGRGKWSLIDVVQGYITFLKEEERRSSKAAAATSATQARTKEIEQRTAMRAGQLIDYNEVEEMFDEITGVYLSSIASLPSRITRVRRERERIGLICDEEQSRVSSEFAKKAENIIASRGTGKAKRAS